MKKTILVLLAILFSVSIMAFPQWTDVSTKKLSYPDSVYVISGENIFHKHTCRLLGTNYTGMPLELAQEHGYKPCPECFPEVTPVKYDWAFSLLGPNPSKGLVYSDNFVIVGFMIEKTKINFIIENKTDSGIKINWDEFSMIYPSGTSSRVIHNGIKVVDRNSPQALTTIPPNAKVSDILIPSENIYYASVESGGWNYHSLFEGDNPLTWNDRVFSVYFPLEIKGSKKEYTFKFKINVSQPTPASAEKK